MNTTKNKIATAKELEEKFSDNVGQAVNFARQSEMDYPAKPAKPFIKHGATSAEAREYAKMLDEYENQLPAYTEGKKKAQEHNLKINEQLDLYIKEISGFNTSVPDDRKDKVWSKAWSDGHSNGHGEVYSHLCELVEIFN